jgi:hypothetical protein
MKYKFLSGKKTQTILYGIGLLVFYFNTESKGADWKFLGKTNEFYFYYDVESVTRTSKDIVRVRAKNVSINDKGKNLVLRAAKEDRRPTKGYEQYTHTIMVHEIRCPNNMARIISVADYNNKDKVLASHTFRNPEWDSIDPDGVGDLLYKEVCR